MGLFRNRAGQPSMMAESGTATGLCWLQPRPAVEMPGPSGTFRKVPRQISKQPSQDPLSS